MISSTITLPPTPNTRFARHAPFLCVFASSILLPLPVARFSCVLNTSNTALILLRTFALPYRDPYCLVFSFRTAPLKHPSRSIHGRLVAHPYCSRTGPLFCPLLYGKRWCLSLMLPIFSQSKL
ncbi:unnamed protein product, partial [Ectocarpus sp. 4 AP-2014]